MSKRLNIGDTFLTTTNRMEKDRRRYTTFDPKTGKKLLTYEVLRPGAVRFFQRGKRIYECEVQFLQEVRTGLWNGTDGPRYWQFTYQVKIVNT